MKSLKRVFAYILVAFFVMMILGVSIQSLNKQNQPGNVAQAVGALAGELLLFVGLYYTAKWNMKLSGHTYKVGRQTVATLLFWYSVFAAFIGGLLPLLARNTFSFRFSAFMLVLWSSVAYACKRWQQRLRRAERSRMQGAPALPIIPLST